jgi:GMP synthase (glutamine-hydrolysing)
VHAEGATLLDPAIYELGIPMLGICYGCQLIAQQLGGEVSRGGRGEYGKTTLQRTASSALLPEEMGESATVWMSHFDAVTTLPSGFVATASTPDAPMAVIENASRRVWGVQHHPEVVHSQFGQDVIERFLHELREVIEPSADRVTVYKLSGSVGKVRLDLGKAADFYSDGSWIL